jgi:hypothetical protein
MVRYPCSRVASGEALGKPGLSKAEMANNFSIKDRAPATRASVDSLHELDLNWERYDGVDYALVKI